MLARATLMGLIVATTATAQERPTPAAALQAKLAAPFLKRADG